MSRSAVALFLPAPRAGGPRAAGVVFAEIPPRRNVCGGSAQQRRGDCFDVGSHSEWRRVGRSGAGPGHGYYRRTLCAVPPDPPRPLHPIPLRRQRSCFLGFVGPLVLIVLPEFGREQTMREVVVALPSVRHVIHVGGGGGSDWISFASLEGERGEGAGEAPRYERMSFADSVYILFTSGTTGPPKCICQARGSFFVLFLFLCIQRSTRAGVRGDADAAEGARAARGRDGARRGVHLQLAFLDDVDLPPRLPRPRRHHCSLRRIALFSRHALALDRRRRRPLCLYLLRQVGIRFVFSAVFFSRL